MLAKLNSMAVLGIEAFEIEIETDIVEMLPSFTIVGLPDGAIRESRERVVSAIKNCGFDYPARKVTVNMAPADIKKEGSAYDLPIALGLLIASDQIQLKNKNKIFVVGELSLDGNVKKVKGILPMVLKARKLNYDCMIVPKESASEAAVAEGVETFPVENLKDAVNIIEGRVPKPFKIDISSIFKKSNKYDLDFRDVKGQEPVKRALLVAAAGGHNILMVGPPGSGKTMIARRIPTILPNLTLDEALETTKIHSVSGLLSEKMPLTAIRPFRSPHHTISDAGLTGGGSYPRPGEISLSHNGVLFLDELPEFTKNVLENLRQPLEDGSVTISRAALSLSYPAKFMLVSAMNPCPCGYYTDPNHECTCSLLQIQRYMSRISGPLLDRIDIHVSVPALSYEELSRKTFGDDSKKMREQVSIAREIQRERFKRNGKLHTNAYMQPSHTRKFCELDRDSASLLKTAIEQLSLSARAYDRILKVSRTIADISGEESIKAEHIAEAVQYRSLDRKMWQTE